MNESDNKIVDEGIRDRACEQYVRRVRYAAQIKKIDDSGMHAGSPVYLYCADCGTPTEVFPEENIFPTSRQCSQCYGLHQQRWMSLAKKLAE